MSYEKLLGNEGLKARLLAQTAERGLFHAYLISGPAGSGKHTLARLLAAAFLCTARAERPCGLCQSCRKVQEEIHPDVRWIKAPGVGEIRALRKDVYIRPNEGGRKVYVVEQMEAVNPSAQNALLKVLEEGPGYAAFLLLTEAEERVLETVRSRCEGLRLSPVSRETAVLWLKTQFPDADPALLSQAAADGILGRAAAQVRQEVQDPVFAQAARFFDAMIQGDQMALLEAAVELESLPRDQFGSFLQALEDRLQACLPATVHAPNTRAALLACFELIRTVQTQVEANVGVGHCVGLLYVLCIEAMEKGAN